MQSKFELILNESRDAVQNLYDYKNKYLDQLVGKYSILNERDDLWLKNMKIDTIILDSKELNQNKNNLLDKKFKETSSILGKFESEFSKASVLEKAEFCYLNARILNAIQSDSSSAIDINVNDLLHQAHQWLTRALKFNPRHVDAWCELGDTCWRQGDLIEATNHFKHALTLDENHTQTLCHQSMLIRHLSNTSLKSKGDNTPDVPLDVNTKTEECPFTQSVQMSHKAVSQNPSNGQAWCALGNALLTHFFNSFGFVALPLAKESHVKASGQLMMKRCLAAYAQAIKDPTTALEPNFHYNRGLAWHYQAFRSWLRATSLDPEWSAPQICMLRSMQFLLECKQMLNDYNTTTDTTDGGTKQTQLEELIRSMEPLLKLSHDTDLPSRDKNVWNKFLGPYNPHYRDAGSGKKSAKSSKRSNWQQTHLPPPPTKFRCSTFDDLQMGSNSDRSCVGRVLAKLSSDSDLTLNVLLVDALGKVMVARLFNVAKGSGPNHKDILAIPHPFIEEVAVEQFIFDSCLLALKSTSKFVDDVVGVQLDQVCTNFAALIKSVDNDNFVRFTLIRIPLPNILVLNGQPIGSSWTAAPVLENIFFTGN